MSTGAVATAPATSSAVEKPTLESKILTATHEAGMVANMFAPGVSALVDTGIQMEPVFKGFAQMIIGIFHHHTGVKVPPASQG
jgi:hypothetical protein